MNTAFGMNASSNTTAMIGGNNLLPRTRLIVNP